MKLSLLFLGLSMTLGCADEPVASVVTGGEENPLDECTSPPLIDHDERFSKKSKKSQNLKISTSHPPHPHHRKSWILVNLKIF